MTASDIVSIVCSILGLVLTVIGLWLTWFIYRRQVKLEERINLKDEEKYKLQIQSEARAFIQKYNEDDEIQLLGLCVIADKYDSAFPYRRQIYKDYCCLNEDVKKELVHILNININLFELEANDFYEASLIKIEEYLKGQFPDQPDIFRLRFYDNAKYFEGAIENHKNELVPNYVLGKVKGSFENDFRFEELIYRVIGRDDLEIELSNGQKIIPKDFPVEQLFLTPTSDGTAVYGKELVISFVCAEIVKYIAMYYPNNRFILDCGYYSDYFGYNDKYMEDLFLEALLLVNYRKNDNK